MGEQVQGYSFKKFQPASLRFWHWLNGIVILGLLATVLIRKTFLSWRTNSALIEEKLKAAGTQITPEFAKEIAVAIRDPLWDWHVYLGFALAALLLGRILIAVFVERNLPGVSAYRGLLGLRSLSQGAKRAAVHYVFVKIGYYVFYLVTLLMVVSGLALVFKTEVGLTKDFSGAVKETHELLMWFFVVFVFGHILGVIVAENGADPGIVSDMINGGASGAETKD